MTVPIPYRNDEYQIEDIDGELLLYHAGKTETLYLNESAAMLWYLFNNERTEQELSDLLVESYPDQAEAIPAQVAEAIQAFVEFGSVELK